MSDIAAHFAIVAAPSRDFTVVLLPGITVEEIDTIVEQALATLWPELGPNAGLGLVATIRNVVAQAAAQFPWSRLTLSPSREPGTFSVGISGGDTPVPAPAALERLIHPPLDYRALLVKYIRHVQISEGVDFIAIGGMHNRDDFAPGEWTVLKRLSEEASADL